MNLRTYWGWYAVLVQLLLLAFLGQFPEVIECYYSQGIYRYIDAFWRFCLGRIPFSVGDVFYLLLILKIAWSLCRWKKTTLSQKWISLGQWSAVVFMIFQLSWGLNYHRQKLTDTWNLNSQYTLEELVTFTRQLRDETHRIHLQITQDPQKSVRVPYRLDSLFLLAHEGYQTLQQRHPDINYGQRSVKKSLLSTPLSYMGFSGYFNPFTHEAQVNALLPSYTLGNVICHEMAHQTGIASESECNFIGFLAGYYHTNPYFRYSVCTAALRYCLGTLQVTQPKRFKTLYDSLHEGVKANFRESKQFWKSYDTPIHKGFHGFYDHFLKVNQQSDGMAGYSKYVGLLMGYTREHFIFEKLQKNESENI